MKNILNSNISNESDDNNNSNIDNNDCVITFNNEYAQQTDQSVFYVTSSKNFFEKHKIVEKKTLSQLFKSIFPFLLPIFMIIFGILSMVIGVSSIFLFWFYHCYLIFIPGCFNFYILLYFYYFTFCWQHFYLKSKKNSLIIEEIKKIIPFFSVFLLDRSCDEKKKNMEWSTIFFYLMINTKVPYELISIDELKKQKFKSLVIFLLSYD